MTEDVLLVGNGVNNIAVRSDWQDLIDELIALVGGKGRIRLDKKPFPLLYEEVVGYSALHGGPTEARIKRFIGERVNKLRPNRVHEELMATACTDILTTNYDAAFEHAVSPGTSSTGNGGVINETLYSLFRVKHVHGKRVWHIHGDASAPRTITLGYEHYSGYLQHMRNYVATGTGKAYKSSEFKPLVRRLRSGKAEGHSWLDFFFTRDVHIIGLTLDFAEIHLWWLLTYRGRLQRERKLTIGNKVRYYCPRIYVDRMQHRIDLLSAVGVEIVPFDYERTKKAESYSKLLKRIEASARRSR